MLTVTVLQGDPDEVREVLRDLFIKAPATTVVLSPEVPAKLEEPIEIEPWTFEEITKYWELMQPNPRMFCIEVALHKNGCHADLIKSKFKWDFRKLAGILTGPAAQLKRFPGKPPIYTREGYNNGFTYKVTPEIASFIKQLNP